MNNQEIANRLDLIQESLNKFLEVLDEEEENTIEEYFDVVKHYKDTNNEWHKTRVFSKSDLQKVILNCQNAILVYELNKSDHEIE